MSSRRLLLLGPCLWLSACGEIRSTVPAVPSAVPAALVGEWSGAWTAAAGDGGGELALRVQEFAGQPVVQITTDLPCLAGPSFQLQLAAANFTVRVGEAVVLSGALTAPGELRGSFGCGAGDGAWQATRTRVLPAVADLTGRWTGTLFYDGLPAAPFALDLRMALDSGVLRLDGDIFVEGSDPAEVVGIASSFDDQGFVIQLTTPDGALRAQASGRLQPLRVELGQFGVFAGGTAIGGGVFNMARSSP
ncbi:MAG: hypothetical protein ACK5AL_12015 [Planctomycetota bacterium]